MLLLVVKVCHFSFHVVSEISVSMHLGFMPHVSCEQLHNTTF